MAFREELCRAKKINVTIIRREKEAKPNSTWIKTKIFQKCVPLKIHGAKEYSPESDGNATLSRLTRTSTDNLNQLGDIKTGLMVIDFHGAYDLLSRVCT